MRTFSDIKGLPVYFLNGSHFGVVEDLVLSSCGTVIGLLIDGNGLFQRDKVIYLSHIYSIGHDSILIDEKRIQNEKVYRGYRLQTGHRSLMNKEILTTSGEKLGLLVDVYFSEKKGTIEAYELTDGFFADVTVGTKTVSVEKGKTKIGKDVIILEQI